MEMKNILISMFQNEGLFSWPLWLQTYKTIHLTSFACFPSNIILCVILAVHSFVNICGHDGKVMRFCCMTLAISDTEEHTLSYMHAQIVLV